MITLSKKTLSPYFQSKKRVIRDILAPYRIDTVKQCRHWYKNNGSPVLLVAHVDTVCTPRLDTSKTGAGFDDRLGVFLADKLSDSYPHIFDMLITDYEETGGSTAEYFAPTHDYNFIIELDREGDDYVDYGCASDDFHKAFQEITGIQSSWGSYSDIVNMDDIPVSKINLGVGTYHSHSVMSGYHPTVCVDQVRKLFKFVSQYKDTPFPHRSQRYSYRPNGKYNSALDYGAYQGAFDAYLEGATIDDIDPWTMPIGELEALGDDSGALSQLSESAYYDVCAAYNQRVIVGDD